MSDQPNALTESPPRHDRLWPALPAGLGAGFIGGIVLVILNPEDSGVPVLIFGLPSLLAAVIGAFFAPTRLLMAWALLSVSSGVGFSLSVFAHPTLNGGERNLWPLELLIFWAYAFIPTGAGPLIGRTLSVRRAFGSQRII
jgi:hypothetical protein